MAFTRARISPSQWSGDMLVKWCESMGSGSSFAKQTSRDVAHVSLLQLVILATHAVDSHVLEGFDDYLDVETHGHEAVY